AAQVRGVDDRLEHLARGHAEEVEGELTLDLVGDDHVDLVLLRQQAQRRLDAGVSQVQGDTLGGQSIQAVVLRLRGRAAGRDPEAHPDCAHRARAPRHPSHPGVHLLVAAAGSAQTSGSVMVLGGASGCRTETEFSVMLSIRAPLTTSLTLTIWLLMMAT